MLLLCLGVVGEKRVAMIEKSTSTIEIRRAGNDEYYFVFRLPSDGMFVSIFFDNISEAMAVAEYLQRKSKDETRYLCKTKSSGENCFVFLTKDNKPIGQSAVFEKVQTMKVGLQYMQKHLQTAEIVDLTN